MVLRIDGPASERRKADGCCCRRRGWSCGEKAGLMPHEPPLTIVVGRAVLYLLRSTKESQVKLRVDYGVETLEKVDFEVFLHYSLFVPGLEALRHSPNWDYFTIVTT